ncbi:adenylate/guanylate cyclase domain-containing protein [Neoroseomonas soli]|uniref:Adenylate/guanylate cyclase domain-containing protein n=1 Tax=Neoroseomonas soli TaxID=1081025 RepID=A0A9X9WQY8_9PROT|nr:adenylate/guanylate cyclase domain-containing protein [Neoroseomonas soli]MBR0669567.1 adenylate/guanylate cyclase domain-containing protein [Neoroseomonas soli]
MSADPLARRLDMEAALGVRRFAAFAFADVVGYTILMATEEGRTHRRWMAVLDGTLRPLAAEHGGRIVKSTGDGVLAEFPTPRAAVAWGLEVQRRLAAAEAQEAETPTLALRIAVHAGEITATDHDIYGQGVNVAARLQEHAPAGGLLLSADVHEVAGGALPHPARDLGWLVLKHLPAPERAFALDPETPPARLPSPPDVSPLPSLAVLPLRNLGGDPQDDYFADGVVEDIVVSLGNLRELMVVSRSSTLAWRGRDADPRDVSRALGVRYVVSGSVRRAGRDLRVQIELSDAHTGTRLWGDRAEAHGGELFALQDRIVERIVSGVAPHVRVAELQRALRKRPESFTAYDLALRGLGLIHDLERAHFEEARTLFERAMAHDPGFALPVAWAARWYSVNVGQGWSRDPRADMEQAATLAMRATELDRQNGLALATYGHVRSFLFHDYDTALVFFERALSASPNSALAWLLSSATLSYVGRTEEAIRHAEHGLRLSPFDQNLFTYYNLIGMAHYAHGNVAEAVRWCRLSHAETPRFTSNLRIMIGALSAAGQAEEARAAAARLVELEPGFTLSNYERTRLPFRDTAIRVRYLADLRAAGLPE